MRVRIKHARLAEELTKRRLSQNAWAHRIGISPGHLSNLVCGRRPYPSTATQRKLLEALDVPFGDLFEIEPDQPEPEPAQAPLFSRALFGLRFKVEREPVPAFRARWTGFGWLGDFKLDVGYALRRFGRSPGFTAVAVLTLGIGLGANVAIFSVADKLLWKPLPYEEPERLYQVAARGKSRARTISPAEYRALRTADSVKAFAYTRIESAVLLLENGARQLRADAVSPGFHQMLGVAPSLGRFFEPEDHRPGAAVAVASHAFWTNQLGADPDAVGSFVRLREQGQVQIIGVARPDFTLPDLLNTQPDLILPSVEEPRNIWALIRLDRGVEPAVAAAEITTLLNAAGASPSDERQEVEARLTPLRESMYGMAQDPALLLLGSAAVLLLMTCANVAGLLFAQGVTRREELALRSALGASRWRVVRQLGSEGLVLGGTAGACGLAVAFGVLPMLISILPWVMRRGFYVADLTLDGRALAFGSAATVIVALIVGLTPAMRHSRPVRMLAGRGLAGGGRVRGEGVLLFVQVSMALVLLMASTLLATSYFHLAGQDLGFEPDNLILVSASLPPDYWQDEGRVARFNRGLLEELRGLPGVERAAAADIVPIIGALPGGGTEVDGTKVHLYAIDEQYFATAGIRLERGRNLTPAEARTGAPVAIVTRSTARRLWGDGDPIGRLLPHGDLQRRIVGVVADVRESLKRSAPIAYVPLGDQNRLNFLVARVRMGTAAGAIIAPLQSLHPEVVIGARPVLDHVRRESSRERGMATLIGALAGISLAVMMIGSFGLVSYAVARRRYEIGVRRALGATNTDIRSAVLRSVFTPVVAGVGAGLTIGMALSHVLEAWLWEINATDPRAIAAALGLLLFVVALACLLPTRQAVRVDPREALQAE